MFANLLTIRHTTTALQKTRDAMLNQLSEYAKRKPKASDVARLENELRDAEANHRVLHDQLVSVALRARALYAYQTSHPMLDRRESTLG